jgi:hypothetical protein
VQGSESETFEAPVSEDNELQAVPDARVGFKNPASSVIAGQENTTSDATDYASATGVAQTVVQTSATDREISRKSKSDQVRLLAFDSQQLEQALADQQHDSGATSYSSPEAQNIDGNDAETTGRLSNARLAKPYGGARTSSGGQLLNK